MSEICTVTANILLVSLFTMLMITFSQPAWSAKMRGLLVMGHETRSLQPCGDDRTLWVSVRSAVRQQLEASVRHVTTRPYEAVYVELNGELSVEPTSGFGADYDGTVEVHQVRLVTKEGIDACRSERWKAKSEAAAVGEPSTYVFVCSDGLAYTVRATGTEAWVFGPEGTHRLPIMPAERGTSYADGVFELWIEGQQAQLGETGGPLRLCRNDPGRAVWEKAKLDGADFRAVGNEPGWSLEILERSRMVLIADYGATRVELPLPEPTVDHDARSTRWDAGEIILEVTRRPCHDSMSGEVFETDVVVNWKERTLKGCGRALH